MKSRSAFVNHELLIALSFFSLLVLFIVGSNTIRLIIAAVIALFYLWIIWFDRKLTMRPGDRVRITRGEYKGRNGIVHHEHNPNHRVRVRVIFSDTEEEMTQELSHYDIEKF